MLKRTIGLFSIIQMFAGGATVAEVRSILYVTQQAFATGFVSITFQAMKKETPDDDYSKLCEDFERFANGCTEEAWHSPEVAWYSQEIIKFANFLSKLRNVGQLVEQKQELKSLISHARNLLRSGFRRSIPDELTKLDEQKAYCQQQKAQTEIQFRTAVPGSYTGFHQSDINFYKHQLALIKALEQIERW